MFNVLVLLEVALDEWDYENGGYNDFSKKYQVFSKEFKLDFAPFIGLEFQGNRWLPAPLKSVRYYFDSNEFICHVETDHTIPIKIDKIREEFSELDTDEIEQKVRVFRDEESVFLIGFYSRGWDIYKPK